MLPALLHPVDPSWRLTLQRGLAKMQWAQAKCWEQLAQTTFLPQPQRILAAFSVPVPQVRYVLLGEAPYPRAASATGYSFMDGAVGALWRADHTGLSREVNRATSLRNFIKMLLVAEGLVAADHCNDLSQVPFARLIQTGGELQTNLLARGFLLLNAALVFRPEVRAKQEALYWQPLLEAVMQHLAQQARPPTVLLWGKVAQHSFAQFNDEPALSTIESPHPYNLSFIQDAGMQDFFRPLHLLRPS